MDKFIAASAAFKKSRGGCRLTAVVFALNGTGRLKGFY